MCMYIIMTIIIIIIIIVVVLVEKNERINKIKCINISV